MLRRDNYEKLYSKVIDINIEPEITRILQVIHEYYRRYEERDAITEDELRLFFRYMHPSIKNPEVYEHIFKRLEEENIPEDLNWDVVRQLLERDYAQRIITTLAPVLSGDSSDILPSVGNLVDEFRLVADVKAEDRSPYVQTSLADLVQLERDSPGLAPRLRGLRSDLGLISGGSLGHVYARPNVGKTTYIMSEMSYWATQLKDDEVIIWFNNEERGAKLKRRLYCSVLGASEDYILRNIDRAEQVFEERGGHRILLYDNASISIHDIRREVKAHNTKAIVIDSGDKVSFRGGDKYNATHERLGRLYQHYREIAKEFDILVLTAAQANADAEGLAVLQLSHMANSKTDKPGELDWAAGIGYSRKIGEELIRYINVTKNKLHHGAHRLHTVRIRTDICRYEEIN